MKAKVSAAAKLADVKLVLLAPVGQRIKRKHYEKAEKAFLLARQAFQELATPVTWAAAVAAGRQLHAEYKRAEREREAAASRAFTDEGGEA
jgi:hypothetical protein